MEWLYQIDLNLFYFINRTIANPFFDWLMPALTEIKFWYSAYLVGIVSLLIFGKKEGRIAVLLLLITIVVSDQISSTIIKHAIGRIRPCNVLEGVRLIYGTSGGLSFPSSHAVNNFAMVSLLSHFYKKFTPYLFVFAFLVALSRVYLGLHYPSDMLGGAIIGFVIGKGVALSYDAFDEAMKHRRKGKYIAKR